MKLQSVDIGDKAHYEYTRNFLPNLRLNCVPKCITRKYISSELIQPSKYVADSGSTVEITSSLGFYNKIVLIEWKRNRSRGVI